MPITSMPDNTRLGSASSGLWSAIRVQFSPAVGARRAAFLCAALAVGIGFTNPLAMSLTEVLLGVMAFFWLLSGNFGERLHAVRHNPVALAALALLALLALSVLYGAAPLWESLSGLAKYRNLLYLVLFVTIFRTARLRTAGLAAFYAAMIVTLAGSFLAAAGVPLIESRYTIDPAEAIVFRHRIVHGLCMAMFTYLMAHRFVDRPRWRWLTGPLALLAAWNTLFMVGGRTGYVALAVLIPLFCAQRLRLRGLACVAAATAIVAAAGYLHSETFSDRIGLATEEVRAYLDYRLADGPLKPEGWRHPVTRTSCGARLEFYRAGLRMFAGRPLLGVGVGNVRHHMEASAEETGVTPNHNLHSEYVMAAAQTGLLGLGLWLALFVVYWKAGRTLSPHLRHLAEGMLAVMLVAGIANTILTERTEGVLFAFFSGLAFAELSERAARARPERHAGPDETAGAVDVAEPLARAA